jgi:UDP-2,3-diacylglucosamine hydrolase
VNKLFEKPVEIEGVVYLASDFHLGIPDKAESRIREDHIVRWLEQTVLPDASHLFLLGDIFDFWFEYKHVVPRGYYRFFNALSQLKNKNVQLFYFTGNHDMWIKNYFIEEFNMRVFKQQQPFLINHTRYLIGHGDGLDPRDKGYLLLKKIFAFTPNIWLYGLLPSRVAFAVAQCMSRESRRHSSNPAMKKCRENESQINYAREVLKNEDIQYFIYGHCHCPAREKIASSATYINTGDWLSHRSYVRIEGNEVVLYDKDVAVL